MDLSSPEMDTRNLKIAADHEEVSAHRLWMLGGSSNPHNTKTPQASQLQWRSFPNRLVSRNTRRGTLLRTLDDA